MTEHLDYGLSLPKISELDEASGISGINNTGIEEHQADGQENSETKYPKGPLNENQKKFLINAFEEMNSEPINFDPHLIPTLPEESESFWNIQI